MLCNFIWNVTQLFLHLHPQPWQQSSVTLVVNIGKYAK